MRTTDITVYPLQDYPDFDSAYWGIGGMNKQVYFGLCTHKPGKSAGYFSFDPDTQVITQLFTLDKVLPSDDPSKLHGKIHTPILEGGDQRLYFGTHFAYPYGEPQDVAYEGGHLMAYDPAQNKVEDFGIAKEGEGIITITLDVHEMKMYALTIPSGYLVQYDINSKSFRTIGSVPSKGSVCRTIAIDKHGNVYGSYEDNGMFIYLVSEDRIEFLDNFFPKQEVAEWDSASRGGVNKIGRNLWRCVVYDEVRNMLYGVFAARSQVFSIDCQSRKLTMYGPLLPDSFAPESVYPTLSLVSTADKLLYIPASGMFDYCRTENIVEGSHVMTFDKRTNTIENSGLIEDQNGRSIYGVAGAANIDGNLYALGAAQVSKGDKFSTDRLFTIDNQPFNLSLIRITV